LKRNTGLATRFKRGSPIFRIVCAVMNTHSVMATDQALGILGIGHATPRIPMGRSAVNA